MHIAIPVAILILAAYLAFIKNFSDKKNPKVKSND